MKSVYHLCLTDLKVSKRDRSSGTHAPEPYFSDSVLPAVATTPTCSSPIPAALSVLGASGGMRSSFSQALHVPLG